MQALLCIGVCCVALPLFTHLLLHMFTDVRADAVVSCLVCVCG